MFYLSHTPFWLRWLFPPGVVWSGDPANRTVYLTFDDGPDPEATVFVLEQLKKYQALGTFFCVGNNVVKHPALFQQIKAEGHAVGNHTMNHIKGWKTIPDVYLDDIREADKHIQSHLFRPPHGRITRLQVAAIRQLHLGKINGIAQPQIIMWSVLSGDFDTHITGQQCFRNVQKHTKEGSIIVFHDSQKAFPRLKEALPATLEWLQEKQFKTGLL